MLLVSLELKNFRSYNSARFDFNPRRNLIVGGNADGKTTALEAIQFLSSGKSPRSKSSEQLIQTGAPSMSVRGRCRDRDSVQDISIQCGNGEKIQMLGGIPGARAVDLARVLPLLHVSPDSHHDFQRESKQRRACIDWFLFHVEQNFHHIWLRYQRTLAQRNAALKKWSGHKSVTTWDDELAMHGDTIQEMRERAAADLAEKFTAVCHDLLPDLNGVTLYLQSGWDSEKSLLQALRTNIKNDTKQGVTQNGPHRNDLVFNIKHIRNKFELSHGQKKLLFIALKIAQIELLQSTCGIECSLLIDDIQAELDRTSQARVVKRLSTIPGQIFATSLDSEDWGKEWQEYEAFHVKHGAIQFTEKC